MRIASSFRNRDGAAALSSEQENQKTAPCAGAQGRLGQRDRVVDGSDVIRGGDGPTTRRERGPLRAWLGAVHPDVPAALLAGRYHFVCVRLLEQRPLKIDLPFGVQSSVTLKYRKQEGLTSTSAQEFSRRSANASVLTRI
jgi:hypothetical protein